MLLLFTISDCYSLRSSPFARVTLSLSVAIRSSTCLQHSQVSFVYQSHLFLPFFSLFHLSLVIITHSVFAFFALPFEVYAATGRIFCRLFFFASLCVGSRFLYPHERLTFVTHYPVSYIVYKALPFASVKSL